MTSLLYMLSQDKNDMDTGESYHCQEFWSVNFECHREINQLIGYDSLVQSARRNSGINQGDLLRSV